MDDWNLDKFKKQLISGYIQISYKFLSDWIFLRFKDDWILYNSFFFSFSDWKLNNISLDDLILQKTRDDNWIIYKICLNILD